jgi:hypothetical protein
LTPKVAIFASASPWSPQAGGRQPFLYVRGCLRLPGSANELLALNARRDAFGFFTQALSLFYEALI